MTCVTTQSEYNRCTFGFGRHAENIYSNNTTEFRELYLLCNILITMYCKNGLCDTYRDYFMVGERVRFLFMSELSQENE